MSNNNTSSGGIGFLGLLTIVFITLRLCEVILWSWWWVLAPLWIPAAILIGVFLIVIAIKIFAMMIVALFSKCKRRKSPLAGGGRHLK